MSDKSLIVDRSKMQRQNVKVQDLLKVLRKDEVQELLDCLMFDSKESKCQILKMVKGKPVHCMGKRDLYALVDGAGKYFFVVLKPLQYMANFLFICFHFKILKLNSIFIYTLIYC